MRGGNNGESLGAPLTPPQLWFVPPGEGDDPPWDPSVQRLSAAEWQWGEALPPPRRRRYWRSRLAMRQVLAAHLGLEPQAVPLQSPPGQPPALPEALGCLSLSHGGGALLIGWSPVPIGVDLELASRHFDAAALAGRFFPAREQQQLAAQMGEPLREAVLRSWVCKEAAIKWRHRSIALELSAWRYDHQRALLCHGVEGTELRPRLGALAGFLWAAVGEGIEALPGGPLTWRL